MPPSVDPAPVRAGYSEAASGAVGCATRMNPEAVVTEQTASTAADIDTYRAMPYSSRTHPSTDPNCIAAVAHLHGLIPPDPAGARVLALGCGDGFNLLAIAAAWPGTSCVGIDLSEAAIERGRTMAAEAGLDNVELIAGDLLDISSPGEFDYVILHGLIGWVPPPVREAAFRLAAESLAPDGLVMANYNALPGWRKWQATRELLLMGAAPHQSPADQLEGGRSALEFALRVHGGDHDDYGAWLRDAAKRAREHRDDLLYHDDFNPFCEPLGVDQAAGLASAAGLAYLGESLSHHWWPEVSTAKDQLAELAGPDPVQQAKLADLILGSHFKSSVFMRGEHAWLRSPIQRSAVATMVATTGPGLDRVLAGNPIAFIPRLLETIGDAGARGVSVSEATAGLGLDAEKLSPIVLKLAIDRAIVLRFRHVPVARHPGERPATTGLVRAELRHGLSVISPAHESVTVDEFDQALLPLLDGTHDRAALAAALVDTPVGEGFTVAQYVDAKLDRYAEMGLLTAEDGDAVPAT
jgi:SAM-dependent methyltransferase